MLCDYVCVFYLYDITMWDFGFFKFARVMGLLCGHFGLHAINALRGKRCGMCAYRVKFALNGPWS